jgi:serine/threonine protein kinase/tetratricopeptide (TPR) repeat protein
MNPERWQEVAQLFHTACELAPAERDAFLSTACPDADLRREVRQLLAFEDADSTFLDHSPFRMDTLVSTTPQLFAEADIVAGRFEIIGMLGHGGMGDVYEAHDRTLGERIALKAMRPVAGPRAEVLTKYFHSEVQLARRITHPGVCRVHDVASHTAADGTTTILLTMELLRGETLAERLKGDPLTQSEALDLGAQIADALDAAHRCRVLHGDLKPSNIIVLRRDDGTPRAVLTDFGLARALDPVPPAGVDGIMMGTPEYMAPEQLQGGPASPRSDLYSFALVVRELLRMSSATPRAGWPGIMARALDENPANRYLTARAIIDALDPPPPQAPLFARLSTRMRVTLGVGVLIVALVLAGWRFYVRAEPTIAEASQVLVTDTLNHTGQPQFDGATEVLRSQLLQSAHFSLLAAAATGDVLVAMGRPRSAPMPPEIAREVALRAGAPIVVYSTLSAAASRYLLDVRLESVQSRPSLARATWTRRFTAADPDGLFSAISDAADWIRQSVGELADITGDSHRPPADTTTKSWEALRLFAEADERHAGGDTAMAVRLLEEALRVDPAFPAAYTRLADLLITVKREREAYASWERAIRLSEERQLTTREHLGLRGRYYEDTRQLTDAETAYRIFLSRFPTDTQAAVWLATVLSQLDQPAEAVTWLERALSARPGWYVALVHLTTTLLDLGRVDDAAAQIAILRGHGYHEWAVWLDGLSRFLTGDVRGALAAVEPLRDSPDATWRSRAFSLRAAWLAEQSQYEQAIAEVTAGIEFDAANGKRDREAEKHLHLADLKSRTERPNSEVMASVDAALAIDTTGERIVRAATILIRVGETTTAAALEARFGGMPEIARVEAARAQFRGLLRLARGSAQSAVRAFESAAALDPSNPPRLALGTALHRVGQHRRAAQVLATEIRQVVRRYRHPDPPALGILTDALSEYVDVLEALKDPTATSTRERLQRLRGGTSMSGHRSAKSDRASQGQSR